MRLKSNRLKIFLLFYILIVVVIIFIFKFNYHHPLNNFISHVFVTKGKKSVSLNLFDVPPLSPLIDDKSHLNTEFFDSATIQDEKFQDEQNYHKLWYFRNKTNLITNVNISDLPLFHKDDPFNDRIVNQLLYKPVNYNKNVSLEFYKKIYLDDGPGAFYKVKLGTSNFEHCPVSTCNIISEIDEADLVVYKNSDPLPKKHPNQIHMAYILESPFHYGHLNGPFDWTSTYRRDSDIVAPYGRWEYYDKRVTQLPQSINYALGKTKKVAWFVSNCHAQNNRLEIATELKNYIDVDIYGFCGDGNLECPRSSELECFKMLQTEYKFYLSFENSNCHDYVTEKFFLNALSNNVLPVVMGGSPLDYRKMSPEKSFIHVDDFNSIEHLGEYLKLLDKDDVLYNSYFQWKGTGELIEPHYWCRVCSMLHIPNKDKTKYRLSDISFTKWWRGKGVCISENWKKFLIMKS
uniref:Fucosyltransferase n=1 Tax=Culicoides sonorensis TaxID=179676 RepID=A0A336KDC8_CULSO